MEEIKQAIPARLKNAAIGGHVAGADDIYDDDMMLTQDVINSIVKDNVVTVSLGSSSIAANMGSQGNVTLTATSKVSMDSISIKKDNNTIAEGSGTTLRYTDDSVNNYGTTVYQAEFRKGGMVKNASITVGAIYYGSGDEAFPNGSKFVVKGGPAGSYAVTVASAGKYVWFMVPASMRINGATKSGFTYPLESPVDVTAPDGETAYKAYRSSNTYDAGTENVVLN